METGRIAFTWSIDQYSGWGLIGLNYALFWPDEALPLNEVALAVLPGEDPRSAILPQILTRAVSFREGLLRGEGTLAGIPVLACTNADLSEAETGIDIRAAGATDIVAMAMFEDAEVADRNAGRLKKYKHVITANNWAHQVLESCGIANRMVHQGYDPVLFSPVLRTERISDGRFRVFSGGKAEWRKGQDRVLEGFSLFAKKHDDALLCALWQSPWPHYAKTFMSTELGMPPGAEIGQPNYAAWAQKAGIRREQFQLLPMTPNSLLPQVLCHMDAAIFMSRAEGGTNIPAMECMGMGLPTILSWNTGHMDLPHQWTANRPEEIAEGLEHFYNYGCCDAREIARRVAPFAWPERIAELVAVLNEM